MTNQLDLPNFVPYLLNRAGVETGQKFSRVLSKYHLTLREWRILIALWQTDGLRLRDLAETTVVDHSTLSRQVASLESAKLVTRQRSDDDGRALCIVLTKKGRALAAKIIPIARAHEVAATRGLTEQQLETLSYCLKRIYENLKDFDPLILSR